MNPQASPLIATVTVVSLWFLLGCQPGEPGAPVGIQAPEGVPSLSRLFLADTSGCNTVSDILLPNPGLMLEVNASRVRIKPNTVLEPTIISFSICSLDTAGTTFYPKCQAVGPTPDLVFLQKVTLEVSYDDAGLPEQPPRDKAYNVFRLNDLTGSWELYTNARVDTSKLRYDILVSGVYAITRDSVWFTSGIITPEAGGTLNLRSSTLTVRPGAVQRPTEVTFAVTLATPLGLPGATDRIFDFSPDGLGFTLPATLSVSFEDAGMATESADGMRFYYLNPAVNRWEAVPTVIDWENQRFVITLSHFSRYGFGRRGLLRG